jgi:ferredoxin
MMKTMIKQMLNMIVRGGKAGMRPSLDGLLAEMDQHLDGMENLIQPAPESKPRTPFDTDLPNEKVSMLHFTPRQRMKVLTKLIPLIYNMQVSARMYNARFRPTKQQATPELIQQLEDLARAAGASDIRYVRVPQNAIFRDKGIPYPYAIVFTVEMDKEPISTSPSFESQHEVMRGYKNLAVIGNKMARFLRKQGYAAYPGTALGGITDYVHLGELAGLGAIGYHGLLISPHEGARLRINTIYTNIENLPIVTENEHLWVRDFCAMCRKCVRKCPVNAIYEQPQPRGDGGMQCIDHATCRDYFTQNYGCAVCLAVCPFSQVGYETVKARFRGNPDAPHFEIPVR